MTAAHNDRDHALYAPSAASRWMACHGSVRASMDIREKQSSAAEEGTECHEAAANFLTDAMSWNEAVANLSDDQLWIVEEYTDYVLNLLDTLRDKFGRKDVKVWFEERIYSSVHDQYHGTGDTVIVAGRTMGIIDLKAGYYAVPVRDPITQKLNKQLASYAVLALDTHKLWHKVDNIRMTIVQPRVYDRPQTIVVSVSELRDFYNEVTEAIDTIEAGDETRVAGSHCKFCPAKGACPALRQEAVTKAKIVFEEGAQRAARNYSPEELEEILNEAQLIRSHLDGIEQHVRRELEKGRKFKNWKLVPKRAMSKWLDFETVEFELIRQGLADILYSTKPKTPVQLANELKSRKHKYDLTPYFVKESSGTTLARMDDPRNAAKYDPFGDDKE